MHRIAAPEEHHRITSGMGRAKVHHVDLFAIDMELHMGIEGDVRQGVGGIRGLKTGAAHEIDHVILHHHAS